jgi:hypothetical protein
MRIDEIQAQAVYRAFPTQRDVIREFDMTQCDFGFGDGPPHLANPWGDAGMELNRRKREWLRDPANEAWYMIRVGIVFQTFEFCRVQHEEIVANKNRELMAAQRELEALRNKHGEEIAAVKAAKDKAEGMIVAAFHSLKKCRAHSLVQWCETIKKNFKHLPV